MSFDLPADIELELERYAQSEHISPADAVVKLVQKGLKATRRKAKTVITDVEVEAYYNAFPGFRAFADVTDEQWDKVLKNARRMSKQGLSIRG